jgi:hypothetical protein
MGSCLSPYDFAHARLALRQSRWLIAAPNTPASTWRAELIDFFRVSDRFDPTTTADLIVAHLYTRIKPADSTHKRVGRQRKKSKKKNSFMMRQCWLMVRGNIDSTESAQHQTSDNSKQC